MPDTQDILITKLELTKEILTELEVPAFTRGAGAQPKASSDRIDEYAKCFRQLWKVLVDPSVE